MQKFWNEKRYYSFDYYLKNTFGEKIYRISLNGGMTCPNRDGSLDTRGCIFCSAGGGIVADSHAEAEYQETFDNVHRILTQLEE